MKCEKLQGYLPDMILDPTRVPAEAMQHVTECPNCAGELKELQATMQLLDSWKAPEPSPYFDTRLAVRLREARESEAARMAGAAAFTFSFRKQHALASGSGRGVCFAGHRQRWFLSGCCELESYRCTTPPSTGDLCHRKRSGTSRLQRSNAAATGIVRRNECRRQSGERWRKFLELVVVPHIITSGTNRWAGVGAMR